MSIQYENLHKTFVKHRNFKLYYRLRWSRGKVLAFSTQVCGFKPGRSRRIFRGDKILITPSFGGEIKPSVPCRRFAACKNLRGSQNLGKIPPFAARISRLAAKVGTSKGGESNGKLSPKTCPGCSVPEPYRSYDWTLVPAKPGLLG